MSKSKGESDCMVARECFRAALFHIILSTVQVVQKNFDVHCSLQRSSGNIIGFILVALSKNLGSRARECTVEGILAGW